MEAQQKDSAFVVLTGMPSWTTHLSETWAARQTARKGTVLARNRVETRGKGSALLLFTCAADLPYFLPIAVTNGPSTSSLSGAPGAVQQKTAAATATAWFVGWSGHGRQHRWDTLTLFEQKV
eukprot:SAG22_NODE_306_length_12671_cov_14.743239_12_plen_122_part_00